MALAAAMQEIIFLKQILGALLPNFDPVCTMYADNKGTIDLAKNPVHHKQYNQC